LEAGIG